MAAQTLKKPLSALPGLHFLPQILDNPLEVDKLYERVSQKLLSDGAAQAFLSKFFSQAHTFGCDKQGRVGLATELLTHAAIEREAVLVGTMTKFSIWSPDRWSPIDPRASGEDLGGLMKEIGL